MSAGRIRVEASMAMARPAAVVRAQYWDIDHHIKNLVHAGIRYQWEPAPAGEKWIRTRFRLLGLPQYDVSRLEEGEDGAFVIRYLEGSNAGTVLYHRFVPIDAASTEVRLSADIPATFARRLLGSIFVAGARRLMLRTLEEDKRDLEAGGYQPAVAAAAL